MANFNKIPEKIQAAFNDIIVESDEPISITPVKPRRLPTIVAARERIGEFFETNLSRIVKDCFEDASEPVSGKLEPPYGLQQISPSDQGYMKMEQPNIGNVWGRTVEVSIDYDPAQVALSTGPQDTWCLGAFESGQPFSNLRIQTHGSTASKGKVNATIYFINSGTTQRTYSLNFVVDNPDLRQTVHFVLVIYPAAATGYIPRMMLYRKGASPITYTASDANTLSGLSENIVSMGARMLKDGTVTDSQRGYCPARLLRLWDRNLSPEEAQEVADKDSFFRSEDISGTIREGLILELVPGNIEITNGKVTAWRDSSGAGYTLTPTGNVYPVDSEPTIGLSTEPPFHVFQDYNLRNDYSITGVDETKSAINAVFQRGENDLTLGAEPQFLVKRKGPYPIYEGFPFLFAVLALNGVTVSDGTNTWETTEPHFVIDSSGRAVIWSLGAGKTLQTVEVCIPDNPFYIRWINTIGGYDYHMFEYKKVWEQELADTEDIENYSGDRQRIDATLNRYLTTGAENIPRDEYDYLSAVQVAPKIQWWDEKQAVWVDILLDKNTLSWDTKGPLGSIEFTFIMEKVKLQF